MTLWSRPLRQSEHDGYSWLALSSENDNLNSFQNFVLDQARIHNVSSGIIQKLDLVLEEVLLNIMNYAYPGDSNGIIEAGCRISDKGQFAVRIIDEGRPFDPSAKPDPDTTLALEDRTIGGLGIFLVRQMSDHVSYQRKEGRNILDIFFRTE